MSSILWNIIKSEIRDQLPSFSNLNINRDKKIVIGPEYVTYLIIFVFMM